MKFTIEVPDDMMVHKATEAIQICLDLQVDAIYEEVDGRLG